jgi:hypothetical protein
MNARKLLFCGLMIVVWFRSYGKGGTNQVIFAAAEQGDVPLLIQIFATNSNAFALRNSLLRTAAASGQKEAVDFLIAAGADVNEKGFFDLAPLANMAMYGTKNDEKCVEVATALLAHGAAMGNCQVSKLFNSFSFLSLKAVFVFFWLRFLFVEQLFLALLQAAIRTRTVSVPGDDSKSVKRNEAHPF